LEAELDEMASPRPLEAAPLLLAADFEARAVGETEPLREVVEHDGASERGGKRGDEQPMVAAGREGRPRAPPPTAPPPSREPPPPVGAAPPPPEQRAGAARPPVREGERPADAAHCPLSVCSTASRRTSASSLPPPSLTGSSTPAAG